MNATVTGNANINRPNLDKGLGSAGFVGFGAAILAAIGYVALSVYSDAAAAGVHATSILPFLLLFIALGLGTMATIFGADALGLPVSTTHVLSSGVAGTMAANKSGLQMSTIRNLLMAWVLTLPISILLSGVLYAVFSTIF